MLTVLQETFLQHTFLTNGLIQGVKDLLWFLSARLIRALSDVWGAEVLPPEHRFLHLLPNPPDEDQPVVGFCNDFCVWSLLRYLLCDSRLCR